MKRNQLFRKIIFSPWFLAFLPALIIMLSIPPLGSKYQLQIEETGKLNSNDIYVDLNSDNITEIVRTGKGFPYYHVLVLDNDYNIHDQWNLKDTLSNDLGAPFFGNFDNDEYSEIYVFSYKNDSVFLNINEFFDPLRLKPESFFISKVGFLNKTLTSTAYPAGFFDENGDGFMEFYFSVASGFSLIPRLVYSFDIVNRQLKSSAFLGVNCHFPKLKDTDGDKKPEIFGFMSASGNYNTPVRYTDWSTWLMVFNEKLEFEFAPVEFPGLTNKLDINSFSNDEFSGYIVSHNTTSADSSVLRPRIMLFNTEGKMIRDLPFSKIDLTGFSGLFILNDGIKSRIYIIGDQMVELDINFNVLNRVKSPAKLPYNTYMEDIDYDGVNEFFLFPQNEDKFYCYNASLEKLTESDFPVQNKLFKFSHSLAKDNKHRLHFTSIENAWFIELKKNNLFYLGYLAYAGIYMLLVLFIVLINRINTYKVQQKERLNQRLLTLQLQGIKSQLDPHFTFNTLNSVASLIYTEDRQAAYDYMTKFTQLLRGMINDAEKIYRSLAEELEFVTTYLELEKLRFGDKFKYTIEIGDGVSQKEPVPKMVLQTFVENSIKHGIMPCEQVGILIIRVEQENNYLKLVVEDNGIGRKKAEGQSSSTGKGLKLTSEFYEILNQINRKPIRHLITDLYNESGRASGTRVEIWVPLTD